MRWQRIGGACRLALTVVVPTVLMASCGEYDGVSDGAGGSALHREGAGPLIESLTCYTDQRSVGIFDHFSEGGGDESPQAAVKAFADGDQVVVDESADDGAAVWVLRPDGTAHTWLGLRQFADSTWIVETQESCADRVGPAKEAKGS